MFHPVSEFLKPVDAFPVGIVGHTSVGRLKWRSGPRSGAVAGLDVAQFERVRIASQYVLLDPSDT